MAKKIEMSILALTQMGKNVSVYTLVLEDAREGRKISLNIGAAEAEAIVLGLEKVTLPRPMTHDIFKNFATEVGYTLSHTLVYRLDQKNMVFYAYLVFQKAEETLELDTRLSDGIAMAVRYNVPIYMHDNVLELAISLGGEKKPSAKASEPKEQPIHLLSMEELNEKLQAAVEIEAYEDAIKIREEINTRLKSKKP